MRVYKNFLLLSSLFVSNLFGGDEIKSPSDACELPQVPPMPSALSRDSRKRQEKENLKNIESVINKIIKTKDKKGRKGRRKREHGIICNNKSQDEKNILIEREVNKLLEEQYEDKILLDKKISLKLKKVSISRVCDLISVASGIKFLADDGIKGTIKDLEFSQTPLSNALKLILNSFTPTLALIKHMNIWKITTISRAKERLFTLAQDRLEKDYLSECVTLFNAKWDEELKKRLEKLWQGIIGAQGGKCGTYIIFDDNSHKVLFRGRGTQIQDFKKFLSEIDIAVPQVRIEARVVVASKDFEESLGFKWSGFYDRRSSVKHFDFVGVGSKTDDVTGIFKDALGWSLNFLPTPIKATAKKATMQLPFLFGNKNFETKRLNLILNAAENKSELRTIVKPSLLVNTDEWAEILVGEELPHETRVSETIEGSLANVTTAHYKDIGTKIKVKPSVAPDHKTVLLDVFVENSSVSVKDSNDQISTLPSVSGGGTFNYSIETSRSKNRVFISSGHTTLIGGLIINTREDIKTGIPGLKDIPIIGFLFKGTRKAFVDKQLLIFITPTLV